ncbi:MAG: hypothetical protein ACYTDX_10930 [Planctomycetota bacterium]|jgi:hypothetical protein
MTVRFAVAALAVLLVAGSASADELHLKNGHTLKGKITESGEKYVFETPGLRMEIGKDEVSRVVKAPSATETLETKRAALDEKDAEAHYRLSLWAKSRKLCKEAERLLKETLLIDADHAAARRTLGFVKWEGKWRKEADLMKERGFVKVGKDWISKEEADRREVENEAEARSSKALKKPRRDGRAEKRAAERARRKRLNAALKGLAHEDPAVRRKGEAALVALAKEMGNPDLEARAPEIRKYYTRLHKEIAAARVRVDVRTQWVTLKRPIPTFETSLGGFSTPVRLQLPEVSVVRINTTAVVPAQVVFPDDDDDWLRE